MKLVNISDCNNTFISFVWLKENPRQIDVQIFSDDSEVSEGDGEK